MGGFTFVQGGLNVCARGFERKNCIHSVSYFNLGGLGTLFGGAKPTKAPRGDGSGLVSNTIRHEKRDENGIQIQNKDVFVNQNRRLKVFNRGLHVCAGGLTFWTMTKSPVIYIVSYFNLRGLGALFWGLSPPNHLWRRDCCKQLEAPNLATEVIKNVP